MPRLVQSPQSQEDTSAHSWSGRHAKGLTVFTVSVVLVALVTSGLARIGRWIQQDVPVKTYVSPDLFFELETPADWTVSKADDSNEVTIVKDDVSVSIAVQAMEETDTVAAFLELNKSKLRQECPAAEQREEGPTTVAGLRGAYFTMFCRSTRLPTIVRISASTAYKKLLIFKLTSPAGALPGVQRAIDRMVESFRPGEGLPEGREPGKRARIPR